MAWLICFCRKDKPCLKIMEHNGLICTCPLMLKGHPGDCPQWGLILMFGSQARKISRNKLNVGSSLWFGCFFSAKKALYDGWALERAWTKQLRHYLVWNRQLWDEMALSCNFVKQGMLGLASSWVCQVKGLAAMEQCKTFLPHQSPDGSVLS